MRESGLRVRELRDGMRIAVEREEAPRVKGTGRQRVIEILPRGVAIDLDGHASLGGRSEHRVPVGDDARARPGDPATRVRKDPDRRVRDGSEHAVGLVLAPSQPRMRCGQHHVERGRLLVGEIQPAGGVDVRLDALQQRERITAQGVDVRMARRCRAASAIDIPPAILSPYEWSVTAAY